MGIKNYLLEKAMAWKMKDVPPEQREILMNMVKKNPDLFKKIGEEIERRVKGGEQKTKASLAVMKKYQSELRSLQG